MAKSGLLINPPAPKAEVKISNEKPTYRVKAKEGWYGPDDVLRKPGAIIVTKELPSKGLEPLNDPAVAAYIKMLEGIDICSKKKAEADGKPFHSEVEAFKARLKLAKERAAAGLADPNVPLMQARKHGGMVVELSEAPPIQQIDVTGVLSNALDPEMEFPVDPDKQVELLNP